MIRKEQLVIGTRKELEQYFSFVKPYCKNADKEAGVAYVFSDTTSIESQLDDFETRSSSGRGFGFVVYLVNEVSDTNELNVTLTGEFIHITSKSTEEIMEESKLKETHENTAST